MKSVLKGPIYNKLFLVQVTAWCWSGLKQRPEQMVAQFSDAYMCGKSSIYQPMSLPISSLLFIFIMFQANYKYYDVEMHKIIWNQVSW